MLFYIFLNSGVKHPVAVFASVQYRFAPEHPFPAAPIDGLSVAAHFLESSPSRKINFGGISAGAYMATITAMECFRKYPGQVKR
jgi:acetyl esterase/lipase